MWVVVYQLRRAGEKLPKEIVRARPAVGWLYLGRDTRKAYPQEVARLFEKSVNEVDVIEPLVFPVLKKIERGGMLLTGLQDGGRPTMDRQAWWVKPGPLDDLTAGDANP